MKPTNISLILFMFKNLFVYNISDKKLIQEKIGEHFNFNYFILEFSFS